MRDSHELHWLLSANPYFKGVYPLDKLPNLQNLPAALVVNTDIAALPGRHWVALWLDREGSGIVFDSFGVSSMFDQINSFMETNTTKGWNVSHHVLQSNDTTVCGDYAVLFLHLMSKKIPFCSFLNLFNDDKIYNDMLVKSLIQPFESHIRS